MKMAEFYSQKSVKLTAQFENYGNLLSLEKYFVKTVYNIICGKMGIERVDITEIEFALTLFYKSFVKSTVFVKELAKVLISRKKFGKTEFLCLPHCVSAISEK